MDANEIIRALKGIKGAVSYDSDYCLQVLVPLKKGWYLRVSGAGEDTDPPIRLDLARENKDSTWGLDFTELPER